MLFSNGARRIITSCLQLIVSSWSATSQSMSINGDAIFLLCQKGTSTHTRGNLFALSDKEEIRGWAILFSSGFPYLGFVLDTGLTDVSHEKLIRERLFKAARAVGQIMRDLRCSSLISLRRYFLSLVSSQLYGLIFVDLNSVNYELAAGVFFRTAMGLADSFPSAAAMCILNVKPIKTFQQEQRMKFLLKMEAKVRSPGYGSLLHDRCVLFPRNVGVNALLGQVLVSLGAPRTLDYRSYFSDISRAVDGRAVEELRASLLVASGRAFWARTRAA